MRTMRLHTEETGATAILIVASLFMLMGFAALVVDIGAGMNERRQDQSAADVAALAGAVEARLLGTPSDIVIEALDYVRSNLDSTYTDPEWEALWLGCVDPEKDQPPLDIYNFQPVGTPSTWASVGTIDCISISGLGYFRVMVPEQILPTTFGRVLGVTELSIDAAAISRLSQEGVGGILPFGLALDVGDGDHACLSSAPTGLADDPCTGSDSGNFGTLKGRMFGTPDEANPGTFLIPPNCNASPLGDVLAINIAAGLDHYVTIDPDNDPANEVRDVCFNPGVDTLNTDTGFPNNGAEQGLATGPISYGLTPRLQQGGGDKTDIAGHMLDNDPLFEFMVDSLRNRDDTDDGDVPISCGGFTALLQDGDYDWDNNGTPDTAAWDWDNDGTLDLPESWEHMAACFADYAIGSHSEVMFCRSDAKPTAPGCVAGEGIDLSPRFAYVPQFWQDDLGNGSSWLRIFRFRAIFLQGTWWKKGNAYEAFHPGEEADCSGCSSSAFSMKQLSAFVIPDEALPEGLKGDPPPGEEGGPYRGVELWK